MLKQINKLCKPSYVYLVLSAITIIIMMVQNAGASGTYKVGMYQCPCNNTAGIFLGKAIYVAFWTFILDAVCKAGYKSVSWFLVLFPMILGAVLVGLVLMSGGIREGISPVPDPDADPDTNFLVDTQEEVDANTLANEEKQPMYEIHKSYQERVQERLRRQSLRYDYVETRIQNELGVDKNRIKTGDNPKPRQGDVVEVQHKDNKKYYPGIITEVNDDGTYNILYTDVTRLDGFDKDDEGYKPIGFFQSFFEKLVNFLTGKGFQNETEEEERRLSRTERGRKLLEIKKQQEKAPKSASQDKLDKMAADTTNPNTAWRIITSGDRKDTLGIPGSRQFRLVALYNKEAKKEESKPKIKDVNRFYSEEIRKGGKPARSNEKNTSVNFLKGGKINDFMFIPTRKQQREELRKQKEEEEEGDTAGDYVAAEQTYNNTDSKPLDLSEEKRGLLNNTPKTEPANNDKTTQRDDNIRGRE